MFNFFKNKIENSKVKNKFPKNAYSEKMSSYENAIKKLIDHSILDVFYYEIDYKITNDLDDLNNSYQTWDNKDFHSLDYGLELFLSNGLTYYFIWGCEFIQYDLKFNQGSITTEFASDANIKKHNVKSNQNWQALLGLKIENIEIIWDNAFLTNKTKEKSLIYPQSVKIQFATNKNLWISALEIVRKDKIKMHDHISLFFDKKTAKKYLLEN